MFQIYNRSEYKRIDLRIDPKSTPWICSKLQKFLKNMSHSISDLKYSIDWFANLWITLVKERSPFTGDLSSKLLSDGHCNFSCKRDAVTEANYTGEEDHTLASCQDKKLEPKTAIALLPMI